MKKCGTQPTKVLEEMLPLPPCCERYKDWSLEEKMCGFYEVRKGCNVKLSFVGLIDTDSYKATSVDIRPNIINLESLSDLTDLARHLMTTDILLWHLVSGLNVQVDVVKVKKSAMEKLGGFEVTK